MTTDMDDLCSVYVGGLSSHTDEDKLHQEFSQVAEVLTVKLIYDKDTKSPKGFGFITFQRPRDATMAIRQMDGKTIDGRVIRVNEMKSRYKHQNRGFGGRGEFRQNRRLSPIYRGRSPAEYRNRSPRERRYSRSRTPSDRSNSDNRDRYSDRRRSRSPRGENPKQDLSEVSERADVVDKVNGDGEEATKSAEKNDSKANVAKEELNGTEPKDEVRASQQDEKKIDDMRGLVAFVEKAKWQKEELTQQVRMLDSAIMKASSTEDGTRTRVQKLERLLHESNRVGMERLTFLRKLQMTFTKLHNVEEAKRSCEKDLKV